MDNVPALISTEDWTSGSSDLNSMYYELWERNVCQIRHPNVELLKQSIATEVVKIPLEAVRTCIAKWSECLRLYINNEGGILNDL